MQNPIKHLFHVSEGAFSTPGSPSCSPSCKEPISSPSSPSASNAIVATKNDDNSIAPNLSTARLLLAHIGHVTSLNIKTVLLIAITSSAALTLFLATTDATIVSTALPTISSQFGASQLEYTWVGVSYMLTQTAFQPLYGRISDLLGRKMILYASMSIFLVGSMLCGGAQSMFWLIIARAIAGIGGGGIVSLVWTITSEIVPIESRAKWSQALSVTWSCSAIAGPLLGGLFSEQGGILSWRWAFYLNLPVCVIAWFILWLSLRGHNVGCVYESSWKIFGRTFDFVGLLLFMSGSSCIVIGFSFATDYSWDSPLTITLIVGGLLILACGGVYEVWTTRSALFPSAAFTDLTTIVILVINFLHNFAFNAGTFYLALYFQSVKGIEPLSAGLKMLPYSLGSSLASMPVAWFIAYWQRKKADTSGQKLVISLGLAISTLGFGLMITLNEFTTQALLIIYPLLAGIGLGMLFHAPYQVFTRGLQPKEMASGTSAFFLVRFTGATVGLSVAGAIFHSRLAQTLPAVIELSSVNLEHLEYIQTPELRSQVVHAASLSIQTIWSVCCPCLGVAFMISVFLRNIPIQTLYPDAPDKTTTTTTIAQSAASYSMDDPKA